MHHLRTLCVWIGCLLLTWSALGENAYAGESTSVAIVILEFGVGEQYPQRTMELRETLFSAANALSFMQVRSERSLIERFESAPVDQERLQLPSEGHRFVSLRTLPNSPDNAEILTQIGKHLGVQWVISGGLRLLENGRELGYQIALIETSSGATLCMLSLPLPQLKNTKRMTEALRSLTTHQPFALEVEEVESSSALTWIAGISGGVGFGLLGSGAGLALAGSDGSLDNTFVDEGFMIAGASFLAVSLTLLLIDQLGDDANHPTQSCKDFAPLEGEEDPALTWLPSHCQ